MECLLRQAEPWHLGEYEYDHGRPTLMKGEDEMHEDLWPSHERSLKLIFSGGDCHAAMTSGEPVS